MVVCNTVNTLWWYSNKWLYQFISLYSQLQQKQRPICFNHWRHQPLFFRRRFSVVDISLLWFVWWIASWQIQLNLVQNLVEANSISAMWQSAFLPELLNTLLMEMLLTAAKIAPLVISLVLIAPQFFQSDQWNCMKIERDAVIFVDWKPNVKNLFGKDAIQVSARQIELYSH